MKKHFLFGLMVAILPNICFGVSNHYTQLVREKQRKMAELEKCMGSTQGLKIAGLSTIGLTAVGVSANISEAKKIEEYDDAIEKKDKDIETIQKVIEEEEEKAAKLEKQRQESKKAIANSSFAINCRISGGTPIKKDDKDNCICAIGKADATGRCTTNSKNDSDEKDGDSSTVSDSSNALTVLISDNCANEVDFAARQKWKFNSAVNNSFRDMASKEKLAVEDAVEIYNRYKNTVYEEKFADLKQEIDDFVIPEKSGETWSCNGNSVSSDDCYGKTFQECNAAYYNCKIESAKMQAEKQTEDEYVNELINTICKS